MTTVKPRGVGMARAFRWVWGILTLLSCGWVVYGLAVTGNVFTRQVTAATVTPQTYTNSLGTPIATSDPKLITAAGAVGSTIGAGISTSIILCTGLPFLLIFGFLYWRNGVAIRHAREHAEMLDAAASKAKPGG